MGVLGEEIQLAGRDGVCAVQYLVCVDREDQ